MRGLEFLQDGRPGLPPPPVSVSEFSLHRTDISVLGELHRMLRMKSENSRADRDHLASPLLSFSILEIRKLKFIGKKAN